MHAFAIYLIGGTHMVAEQLTYKGLQSALLVFVHHLPGVSAIEVSLRG